MTVVKKVADSRLGYIKKIQNLLRLNTVKNVSNVDELRAACQLVYSEYLRQGYCDYTPTKLRYSDFDLSPDCVKAISIGKSGSITGTASLVIDSGAGLPAETAFKEELSMLRKKGWRIAEGSMFAVDHKAEKDNLLVAPRLMASILSTARNEGVSHIVVVVNPKHVGFYLRCLGFEAVSSVKTCSHVKEAPGVLLVRNIQKISINEIRSCAAVWQLALLSIFASPLARSPRWSSYDIASFLGKDPEAKTRPKFNKPKNMESFTEFPEMAYVARVIAEHSQVM
jgi:N-acyl-L-homoserine lactone synthetase